MLVAFWALKGGVGTTVSAAICALRWSRRGREVLLVDLGGDLPAALGCDPPSGPGCAEWLQAGDDAEPKALGRLEFPVTDDLRLLPRGIAPIGPGSAGERLVATLSADTRLVVVDCGPPLGSAGPGHPAVDLAARADHSWLVVRACYLALSRAINADPVPTAVVLQREPGRALDRRDVAAAIGVPVAVEVAIDQGVARSVDSGLLRTRLPAGLGRVIDGVCPRV